MKYLCTLICSILLTATLNAQTLTPMTVMIPTSNGDSLEADVYLPNMTDTFPVILIQTPYGKFSYKFGLPLKTGTALSSSNYAWVVLDWRGRFTNLSKADGSVTNGEDGYDVVQWIAAQTWSDGKIGTWGPSALGNVQFQTAREQPPNLVCAVPIVAAPQTRYVDYYEGGSLRYDYVASLDMLGFGVGAVVVANPFYNLIWSLAEGSTIYPEDIEVPMLMIGGWYDHNTESMLFQFDTCRTSSDVSVRNEHRMLMGPWVHGGNGPAYVGSVAQGELSYPDAGGISDTMARRFFDYYLRGKANGWDTTSAITFFQMGEDEWRYSSDFPPSPGKTTKFYLGEGLDLMTTMSGTESNVGFDYDPNDPSPTYGGKVLGLASKQGPYDQRDTVESRSDVLVFTSEEFTEALEVQGEVKIKLFVSSDRKDTDFAVRLTDVYPDGRSMLLEDAILRMRFRDGFTTADTSSMVPGTIYEIEISLDPTAITFLPGHKIRLIVSSSNYPMYNRNMNTGDEMYPGGNMDTLVSPLIANNKVYTGGIYASYIELPITPGSSGIADVISSEQVNVFPNPASSIIHIPGFEEGNVKIVSMLGTIDNQYVRDGILNVDRLTPGIYGLSWEKDGKLFRSSFVRL